MVWLVLEDDTLCGNVPHLSRYKNLTLAISGDVSRTEMGIDIKASIDNVMVRITIIFVILAITW